MKDFFIAKAINVALPILTGILTPYVLDFLKSQSARLDAAPPAVKQFAAFFIASTTAALGALLNTTLPSDLAVWDTAGVQVVVGGLLGIAIKQQRQVKMLKAAATSVVVLEPYDTH